MCKPPETLYIFEEIESTTAENVVQWLDAWADYTPRELTIKICSEGGSLDAAQAIITAMKDSPHPITTIANGQIQSSGFLIFIAGDNRKIHELTTVMSHQYSWGKGGKHHELVAANAAYESTHRRMCKIIDLASTKYKNLSKKYLPDSDLYVEPEELIEDGLAEELIKYEVSND